MGRVDFPWQLVAIGLTALGVAVLTLGHRQVVHTTPLIQVLPSYEADITQLQAETDTLVRLNSMSHPVQPV